MIDRHTPLQVGSGVINFEYDTDTWRARAVSLKVVARSAAGLYLRRVNSGDVRLYRWHELALANPVEGRS